MRVRKSHICLTCTVLFVVVGSAFIYQKYKAIDARLRTSSSYNYINEAAIPYFQSAAHAPAVASTATSSPHSLPSQGGSAVVDQPLPEIVVAVVACGMRLQETLNMLKSVIIFNVERRPLRFMVITESALMTAFQEKLEDWQALTKNMFRFKILPLSFPTENTKEWRNLFKPCASQRLFLPVRRLALWTHLLSSI